MIFCSHFVYSHYHTLLFCLCQHSWENLLKLFLQRGIIIVWR
nr:MAG TPA: hypothetical protein [Caudoviricetes sp.]